MPCPEALVKLGTELDVEYRTETGIKHPHRCEGHVSNGCRHGKWRDDRTRRASSRMRMQFAPIVNYSAKPHRE
ncbi:MAG: hypothetical protein U0792_02865 [Gemmataceae bacterium]